MKSKLMILTVVAILFCASQIFAEGEHNHGAHDDMGLENPVVSESINVGNKICPVSGEKIGLMGDAVEIEHNGKIYNLCCAMCAKDFKKDPAKHIKIINEELENSERAVGIE